MVGLRVEFYWYQIGAASFLYSFFSTVCFRLEQRKLGSRFPRLMNDLYQGRLKSEYVKDALVELKEIKQELEKFPPSDVIWDMEDLSASLHGGTTSAPKITNLSNYFVTSDGEDFILILQQALEKALEIDRDLIINSK